MENVEKIKSEMLAIKDKVDASDRLEAMKKFVCHHETISRYLRGEVKKEAFGLKLLGFLKDRIATREKALA